VLGVLGGIASGKSAVARMLAGEGGILISADELAREVLDLPEVRERVAGRFGAGLLAPDGKVDRTALARLVFDPRQGFEARRALEGWTHPLVRDRIMDRLDAARAAGVPRIVLDVPLLLENDAQHGLVRLCDALVFVEADEGAREHRARAERGWPEGEVARREAAQLPLGEKRRRAQHVIPNNGSLQDLERSVAELSARLAGG
jgi:dephospho-CoA kinase